MIKDLEVGATVLGYLGGPDVIISILIREKEEGGRIGRGKEREREEER